MTTDQKHPKKFRLLKPDEFKFVYKNSDWTANRETIANFRKNDHNYCRLGITVSKKVSKRAVDRNRIKRQIREWFRKKDKQSFSIDIILTAKPSLNLKTSSEIQQSLEDVWKKIQKKSS